MADILINQLPAGNPLLTDLLILANPNTGIAKKSTVTQLNSVLTLAKLSDVTQVTPPANSILEWDGSFSYITNVVRANGPSVGYVPTFSATSPIELSPSILKETAYGLEISEDQYINNSSVLFGLSSITKGFVMPKMTSSDRTAISLPLKGIEVFDTTFNIPYFYNGSAWKGVQEVLVSANNIKTINGTTILGSGNLTIASGITTLNALTASTQTFAVGSSGTDFTITSASSTHTFNIPTASASARGLLSSANWTTFNNKIDGSGTANYLSKFTASGTVGDSQLIDNGSKLKMGTNLQLGGTISDVASSFVIDLYNSANYRFQTYNGNPFLINPLANGVIIGGNTSLGQNLSVYNGIATDGTIRANDLGLSSNNFRFTYDTEGAKIQSYASKPLILNSLGNNVLINRITDNGLNSRLQVNGSGYFQDNFIIENTSIECYLTFGSTNTLERLKLGYKQGFYAIVNNSYANIIVDDVGNLNYLSGNGASGHKFYSKYNSASNTSEAMRITNDGNLLINRTTDDGTGAILQVNGSFSIKGGGSYPLLIESGINATMQITQLGSPMITHLGVQNTASIPFGRVGTLNNYDFSLTVNNIQIATVTKQGNFLIGTLTDITSSILTVDSTTKGILIPRMTTAQINAISSPATGLQVYNTTLQQPCFYDGSGWRRVSHTNM